MTANETKPEFKPAFPAGEFVPSPKAFEETPPGVPAPKPFKRYRLLTRAQIDGMIREPGYIFNLEEGKLGPCHTESAHSGHGAEVKDIKDYEEVTDEPVKVDHGSSVADAAHPDLSRPALKPQGVFDAPVVEHGPSVADLPPKNVGDKTG